jgi:hypothetical protein
MIPNPIPSENCTDAEARVFLENHIKNLDEKITQLETALTTNESAKQQRAWAIDMASRFFDKTAKPNFDAIEVMAMMIYDYAEGSKQ